MQKESYDFLYRQEDNYWYQQGRKNLVDFFLRCILKEHGGKLKILDVGSGTGGMFNLLKNYGEVTGLEFSEYAAQLCLKKHPGVSLKIGSANNISAFFPNQSFDLVVFFNVLYHRWIEDDARVLKQAAGLIKPGGYVILNEPAFNCLYRDNDKICYGIRRYSERKISKILLSSGLTLEKSTYFNSISFVPALALSFAQRYGLIQNRGIVIELRALPGYLNTLLKYAMALERMWILSFGRVPFGVSILSIAKKAE